MGTVHFKDLYVNPVNKRDFSSSVPLVLSSPESVNSVTVHSEEICSN